MKLKSTGFVAQEDRRKKEIKDDLTVLAIGFRGYDKICPVSSHNAFSNRA